MGEPMYYVDCANTKFGEILIFNSNGKPDNIVNVGSSYECADSCEGRSCKFWSFEGKYKYLSLKKYSVSSRMSKI